MFAYTTRGGRGPSYDYWPATQTFLPSPASSRYFVSCFLAFASDFAVRIQPKARNVLGLVSVVHSVLILLRQTTACQRTPRGRSANDRCFERRTNSEWKARPMPDTLVPGMVHLTARKAARKTDHRTELRAAIERLYEYSPHSVGKEWAGGPARERIPELRAGRMSKSFGRSTIISTATTPIPSRSFGPSRPTPFSQKRPAPNRRWMTSKPGAI